MLALRGALVLGTARTKGEGCGCVRDASRQGGRLLLRAFRSFVCARVQRRANTFRHAPTVFQECNEIGCDTGHQHPATRGDLK